MTPSELLSNCFSLKVDIKSSKMQKEWSQKLYWLKSYASFSLRKLRYSDTRCRSIEKILRNWRQIQISLKSLQFELFLSFFLLILTKSVCTLRKSKVWLLKIGLIVWILEDFSKIKKIIIIFTNFVSMNFGILLKLSWVATSRILEDIHFLTAWNTRSWKI